MSFDPATMMLIGGGLSAVGSIFSGQANSDAANYNAAIAQQNAEIARQQGQAAVEAQQRDAARKIGSMVAAYGASGVSGSSGSPMDVLADSARMAELDKLTTQYNYELKAAGYENQSTLDKYNSQASSTSGLLGALGTGISAFGKYQAMNSIPGFGVGNTYDGMYRS